MAKLAPKHFRWDEFKRHLEWVSKKPGRLWGRYPKWTDANLSVEIIRIPPRQHVEFCTEVLDAVIIPVREALEIEIGFVTYNLLLTDQMVIPPHTKYSVVTPSDREGTFFLIQALKEVSQPNISEPIRHISSLSPDYTAKWTFPRAGEWGMRRASFAHYVSTGVEGHLGVELPGQSTPWHAVPFDIALVCIRGEVEFATTMGSFPLNPMDVLMIPKGVPYAYHNYGFDTAIFVTARPRYFDGESIYFDNEEMAKEYFNSL